MKRGLITLAAALATGAGIAIVEHLGLRNGRLVECLLIFLGAVCAAWAGRGWVRNAALVVCSLAFGLAVVQGLLPLLFPQAAAGKAMFSDDGLAASKDVVGWGPRHPGVFHLVKRAANGRTIFDIHATIDEAYHRKTVPSNGPRPIAFFGDSFIFGDGLDDASTLPQAFADLTGGKIPVLNLGFSGWAPSQNLAALERGLYSSELVSPRRMILFTSLFHIERTACKGAFALGSGPRYVLDGPTVKQEGTCVGSRPKFITSILRFVRGFMAKGAAVSDKPTARDVETYIKIIEAFAATARRDDHVGATVLMEPGGDQYVAGTGYDQAKIVGTLRAAGVDVLVKEEPPAGEERLYRIEGDGHPTRLANQAIARQLEDHLKIADPAALRQPAAER